MNHEAHRHALRKELHWAASTLADLCKAMHMPAPEIDAPNPHAGRVGLDPYTHFSEALTGTKPFYIAYLYGQVRSKDRETRHKALETAVDRCGIETYGDWKPSVTQSDGMNCFLRDHIAKFPEDAEMLAKFLAEKWRLETVDDLDHWGDTVDQAIADNDLTVKTYDAWRKEFWQDVYGSLAAESSA